MTGSLPYKFHPAYKKRVFKRLYDDGGDLTQQDTEERARRKAMYSSIGMAASTAGNLIDSIAPPNQYGRQSMGVNIAKDAGNLAAAGSAFGPVGLGVGAVLGAGKGIIDSIREKEQETQMKMQEKSRLTDYQQARYAAQLSSNPNLARGTRENYFDEGGLLTNGAVFSDFVRKRALGGTMRKLSEGSVEVEGPSHEGGGVALGDGDEVEGKETISNGYVFSHRLGFAQLHKPIATAIGKIEKKAPTSERINSLKRLRAEEQKLYNAQEAIRSSMGLNNQDGTQETV